MHVRVLLSRYRAYTPCPVCQGRRFQPDALLYRVGLEPGRPAAGPDEQGQVPCLGGTLSDFYQLPVGQALRWVDQLSESRPSAPNDPLRLVLTEVRSRLKYLDEVGLGYLTLDRPTRSLSGGETERVSLTTCLGTRLVNTLFVLDEPSVGLHARDTERLVRILQQLRDAGNTVVVVEHEASVMRAADQIIDLGPGHGATGGKVVFQGSCQEILGSDISLTGQYLSGRKQIDIPDRRMPLASRRYPAGTPRIGSGQPAALNDAMSSDSNGSSSPALRLSGATLHNLKNLSVQIPLERFVCVTGVSGSGKTTLVREVLLPALAERLKSGMPVSKASDRLGGDQNENADSDEALGSAGAVSARLEGAEPLRKAVLVDQSILGKTPRSNPAVYIGAFDDIREIFAGSEQAKRRGLNASAFSFNSTQGQCERCRGAGFEKIEMQFLSDVYIRCPECDGRRYRSHILDIKVAPSAAAGAGSTQAPRRSALSIADVLDSTVDEAVEFLAGFEASRYAVRAAKNLSLLQETGLGYLKLGQPINTLSGGESQRLKLVKHLAESVRLESPNQAFEPTLFLFDEPTTGLHFDDVRVLLKLFHRLVDAGHSVLVVEHNLDVIKSADWVIDLGPEAGENGGRIVAEGTPEQVATCESSHTGRALRETLQGRTAPAIPGDTGPAATPLKPQIARTAGTSSSRERLQVEAGR